MPTVVSHLLSFVIFMKMSAAKRSSDSAEPSTRKSRKGVKRMTAEEVIARMRRLSDALVTEKYDKMLSSATNVVHADDGSACWESHHATTKTGYCQLNLNGAVKYGGLLQGNYTVHLWSLRYHNRLPAENESTVECSHLCHNKKCFNPAHLHWENGINNRRRNNCPHRVNGVLICPYVHDAPACLAPHWRFTNGRDPQIWAGYNGISKVVSSSSAAAAAAGAEVSDDQ